MKGQDAKWDFYLDAICIWLGTDYVAEDVSGIFNEGSDRFYHRRIRQIGCAHAWAEGSDGHLKICLGY